MALEILLATRNQKKKLELQELLDNPGIRILTLEDIDHIPEIIEDGCTFEENAVKKARMFFSFVHLNQNSPSWAYQ